jgi:hypothetical protein
MGQIIKGRQQEPALFLWQFSLLTKQYSKDKPHSIAGYANIVHSFTDVCHLYTFSMYVNNLLKIQSERPQTAI